MAVSVVGSGACYAPRAALRMVVAPPPPPAQPDHLVAGTEHTTDPGGSSVLTSSFDMKL